MHAQGRGYVDCLIRGCAQQRVNAALPCGDTKASEVFRRSKGLHEYKS
jgi:hypothetical protein